MSLVPTCPSCGVLNPSREKCYMKPCGMEGQWLLEEDNRRLRSALDDYRLWCKFFSNSPKYCAFYIAAMYASGDMAYGSWAADERTKDVEVEAHKLVGTDKLRSSARRYRIVVFDSTKKLIEEWRRTGPGPESWKATR